MQTIQYDTPIEVSKDAYNKIMANLSGIAAGQEIDGKYIIKVWLMKYIEPIKKIIEIHPL